MTKEEILSILSKNDKNLKTLGVKRIGLFGSYVRGEESKGSDIDLLVEYVDGKKNFKNFMNTVYLAQELLGENVDVITQESLSPHIAPYIKSQVVYV